MEDKIRKSLLVAGVGLSLSASAALMYYFLKRDDEEYSPFSLKRIQNVSATSRQTLIRVKIPKELVGSVIGRQGSVIKELQEQTNTRIRFSQNEPKGLEDHELIIRGAPADAQEAETLIMDLINEHSNITVEELFIPVRACGRIIGRNGDNVRHMSVVSKAKITIDRGGNERDPDNMKRVTIKGTKDQISAAVLLIDEKLAEEEMHRNKVISSCKDQNRYSQSNRLAISFSNNSLDTSQSPQAVRQERLEINSPDGFIEVYISAVQSPGRFWVQLIGPKAVELDKLVEDMTDHYEIASNRLPVCDNAKVGDLVAASFRQDSSWYRARVEQITRSEYSEAETTIDVHFVDFGDDEKMPLKEACTLYPDFDSLSFQAIECCLAHVKSKESDWSKEAIETFEKLTHASQWKVVMAKPLTAIKGTTGKEVFYVEIVDTNSTKDINVAKELIKLDLAIRDKTQTGAVAEEPIQ